MSREGEKWIRPYDYSILLQFLQYMSHWNKIISIISKYTSRLLGWAPCTETLPLHPPFRSSYTPRQKIPSEFQRYRSQVWGFLCKFDWEKKEKCERRLQKLRQIAVGAKCPKVNFWTSKLLYQFSSVHIHQELPIRQALCCALAAPRAINSIYLVNFILDLLN